MRHRKLNSQSGISAIELIIVIVIIGVVVVFAVAQFGSAKPVFDRQNAAREMRVGLERARFDSIKRRTSLDTKFESFYYNDGPKSKRNDRGPNRDPNRRSLETSR
jgi:Tfp pilus assembly protein FimT